MKQLACRVCGNFNYLMTKTVKRSGSCRKKVLTLLYLRVTLQMRSLCPSSHLPSSRNHTLSWPPTYLSFANEMDWDTTFWWPLFFRLLMLLALPQLDSLSNIKSKMSQFVSASALHGHLSKATYSCSFVILYMILCSYCTINTTMPTCMILSHVIWTTVPTYMIPLYHVINVVWSYVIWPMTSITTIQFSHIYMIPLCHVINVVWSYVMWPMTSITTIQFSHTYMIPLCHVIYVVWSYVMWHMTCISTHMIPFCHVIKIVRSYNMWSIQLIPMLYHLMSYVVSHTYVVWSIQPYILTWSYVVWSIQPYLLIWSYVMWSIHLLYLAVTSYGEPLATWLAVRTFSQVVSISALQTQGRYVHPYL